jgi:hypothetical protein
MTAMQDITPELAEFARQNGYVMDLGGLTKERKRELEQAVRNGEMVKCRAIFPNLTFGISSRKTTYVRVRSAGESGAA